MADWALSDYSRFESAVVTSSRSGSAHVKGAWAQVIAATAFAYERVVLSANIVLNTGSPMLADVGIGSSGSEVVVLPDILVDMNTAQGVPALKVDLRFRIPSGSRIAVRHQDAAGTGTKDLYWGVIGYGGGFKSPASLGRRGTNYGADAANTTGVTVTPSATANTWGAWTEITAATDQAHHQLLLCVGSNKLTTQTGGNARVQLGIGASGSEQPIGEQCARVYGNQYFGAAEVVPVSVPAGTRLSARCQLTSPSGSARSVVVIGL